MASDTELAALSCQAMMDVPRIRPVLLIRLGMLGEGTIGASVIAA